MRKFLGAISLAALFGLGSSLSVAAPPKPKLNPPTITCVSETQTTITLGITGGATYGAPSGFSLHWTSCANLAANGGVWPSEDAICHASFSGNASGAYFNLDAGETVEVTIGALGDDERPGISWTCGDDVLECGTCYVFRAFAHGDNTYAKSDWSADHECMTEDCGDTGCGTGFAKGPNANTWIFYQGMGNPDNLSALSTKNGRWGWALNVSAADGTSMVADLWVGAGGNNTANGTNVGTVTISVNGTTVTVEYDLFDGYSLDEVHVYASDTKPVADHGPTGDVDSPGGYGYTDEAPDSGGHTATFTLSDSNGDGLWIIAHAVVCGVPTGE